MSDNLFHMKRMAGLFGLSIEILTETDLPQ